jgi:hypothetical protein
LKVWAEKQFTQAEKIAEKAAAENKKDDGSEFSLADIKL